MIAQTKDMQYDFDKEEYFLTADGITNNTDYTSAEIGLILKPNTPKWISQAVYRLIYDAFPGFEKYAHIRCMKRLIYDDEYGERKALFEAFVEMAKGAIESGMDLNPYTNNQTKPWYPPTVISCLKKANLINPYRKEDSDEFDIVYTADDREVN